MTGDGCLNEHLYPCDHGCICGVTDQGKPTPEELDGYYRELWDHHFPRALNGSLASALVCQIVLRAQRNLRGLVPDGR